MANGRRADAAAIRLVEMRESEPSMEGGRRRCSEAWEAAATTGTLPWVPAVEEWCRELVPLVDGNGTGGAEMVAADGGSQI